MSSAKYPLSFLTSIGGDTAMESIVLGWNSVRKSQRDLVLYFNSFRNPHSVIFIKKFYVRQSWIYISSKYYMFAHPELYFFPLYRHVFLNLTWCPSPQSQSAY